MPNFSLLFAPTVSAADHVAILEWKWDKVGDLGRDEYRRPDTGEHVRFVPDLPDTLRGLRWNTKVYLIDGWRRRSDASHVMGMLDSGFFLEGDPVLPPPKSRRDRNRETLSELRHTLDKLTREQRK